MQSWQSLPEKFLNKIELLTTDSTHNAVLESFCHEKPVSIRVNTLKSTKDKVLSELQKNAIPITNVAWYTDAFITDVDDKQRLTNLESYKQGDFYIQNLSSMIPALVVEPRPNECILDLCAAPGSKTTQMAALMNNTGTLIANDRSRQRIFKLQAVLKEQGVTNTRIISKPGEILWKSYPNYFDKVLVDAPCSMEGRFLAQDNETYRDWSPKKVKLLSQSQKWLLRSAVTMTKPGGTVVYSTCTLSPEENEEVLDWLLKNESYPITIEKIDNEIPGVAALQSWNGHSFASGIENAMRILPDSHMEGFFVAKIRKTGLE